MLSRSDRCGNLPRGYPPQRGGALSFLGGAQIDDSADTEPIHRTIIIGSQARQIFRAIQQSMADAVSVGRSVSAGLRSEEHTSELQSLMRLSYAVYCLKHKKHHTTR